MAPVPDELCCKEAECPRAGTDVFFGACREETEAQSVGCCSSVRSKSLPASSGKDKGSVAVGQQHRPVPGCCCRQLWLSLGSFPRASARPRPRSAPGPLHLPAPEQGSSEGVLGRMSAPSEPWGSFHHPEAVISRQT